MEKVQSSTDPESRRGIEIGEARGDCVSVLMELYRFFSLRKVCDSVRVTLPVIGTCRLCKARGGIFFFISFDRSGLPA